MSSSWATRSALRTPRGFRLTGLVLATLLVGGCGSGGSSGATPTAAELTGWWDITARESASGAALWDGVQPLELLGVGSSLYGCGTELAVSGSTITDPTDGSTLAIVDANRIVGTTTLDPGTGPIAVEFVYARRTQAPPVGVLDAMGTVGGAPLLLNSTVPTASLSTLGGTGVEITISDCAPMRAQTDILIELPGAAIVTGMPYAIGMGATPAFLSIDTELTSEFASTGTVTFSQGTGAVGSRLVGTFTATLGGGGPLSGTFDVEVFRSGN